MQGATELDEGFKLGPVGEDRRALLTTATARGRGGRRGRGFRRIRICSLMNIIEGNEGNVGQSRGAKTDINLFFES